MYMCKVLVLAKLGKGRSLITFGRLKFTDLWKAHVAVLAV